MNKYFIYLLSRSEYERASVEARSLLNLYSLSSGERGDLLAFTVSRARAPILDEKLGAEGLKYTKESI